MGRRRGGVERPFSDGRGGSREEWKNERCDLLNGLAVLGVKPSSRQIEQFMEFYSTMRKWNQVASLVSKGDEKRFVRQHVLPCATALKYIPEKVEGVTDVGTGGGLPGIPLKILRPDMKLVLIEARLKKVLFLQEVVRKLKLCRSDVVHSRAEDVKGRYSFVVTRGVGRLAEVLEVCIPLLEPEGILMIFKGDGEDGEIKGTEGWLRELGAVYSGAEELVFPLTSKEGRLLFFSNVSRET